MQSLDEFVSVMKSKGFLFLNVEMEWFPDDDLSFRMYIEPNQRIEYVENDPCIQKHAWKQYQLGYLEDWQCLTKPRCRGTLEKGAKQTGGGDKGREVEGKEMSEPANNILPRDKENKKMKEPRKW